MKTQEAPSSNQASVGGQLSAARTRLGWTVEEAAARTRLHLNVIRNLEANRFEKLPSQAYVRGFLRIYSRELGLDPKSILKQFQPSAEIEDSILDLRPEMLESSPPGPPSRLSPRAGWALAPCRWPAPLSWPWLEFSCTACGRFHPSRTRIASPRSATRTPKIRHGCAHRPVREPQRGIRQGCHSGQIHRTRQNRDSRPLILPPRGPDFRYSCPQGGHAQPTPDPGQKRYVGQGGRHPRWERGSGV